MPSCAPNSAAWPIETGPAPMTSCSAMTSGLMARMTPATRVGLVRPSSPRHRWMLYVATRSVRQDEVLTKYRLLSRTGVGASPLPTDDCRCDPSDDSRCDLL